MRRIGIDNGAKGAIVVIDERLQPTHVEPMPVLNVGVVRKGKKGTKNVLDMRRVVTLFQEVKSEHWDVYAVLEHAQVFPGEGRSTAFTAGRGYGALEMALVAVGIPYEIVRPRKWQTEVLRGVEGSDTKVRGVLKCQREFPTIDLTPGRRRKPMDGISDAACMALYATMLRPERRGGK
jgi:crossover junction endodeoxyribonuclease RuvC